MGSASKVVSVFLRLGELVCSVIVLGIVGYFLSATSDANIYSDSRLVYTTVVASLGTFFSLILLPPFTYSFLAFPIDFIMAILWFVSFCLLEALTGINTCYSNWYWSYWGYYWGGYWRTPVVVSSPYDIAFTGCSSWRAVLAWSFIAFFLFGGSAILGVYVVAKYREEKRNQRNPPMKMVSGSGGPPTDPQSNGLREEGHGVSNGGHVV
ncbi:hypothetical protein F5883DRAFT_533501 [Diaporthe sp. PMI_573]|nr:hypothetical protein F5883DRAFT_533501 [Diaporthaceae sp. PMI_573]